MGPQRHRLTIGGLLALVLFLALGFTALRSPSPLWAAITFSVVLVSGTLAILLAIESRGPERSFWRGFAVCGLSSLILSCAPWFEPNVSPYLVTTAFLEILAPSVVSQPLPSPPPGSPGMMMGMGSSTAGVTTGPAPPPNSTSARWNQWARTVPLASVWVPNALVQLETSEAYRKIGHSLFSLMFAVAGGSLARRIRLQTDAAPGGPRPLEPSDV